MGCQKSQGLHFRLIRPDAKWQCCGGVWSCERRAQGAVGLGIKSQGSARREQRGCESPAMVPAAEEETWLQKGCDLQVTPILPQLPDGSRHWVYTSSTLSLHVVRNGPDSVTCIACQATEASCFVTMVYCQELFRNII